MQHHKFLKLFDDVLRFCFVSLFEIYAQLNNISSIRNRNENVLILIALVFINLLDNGVRVALYALCLTLKSGHCFLESTLFEVKFVCTFKLFSCERNLHSKNFKEFFFRIFEIVILNNIDDTVPNDI